MAETRYTLQLVHTLAPPKSRLNERVWHSAPHPRLPLVATAASDQSVRIYSLLDGKLVSQVSGGHKRSVRASAWKPNLKGESVLATASFDATIGVWRRWEDEDGLALRKKPPYYAVPEDSDELEIAIQLDSDDEEDEWRFAVVLEGHDSEVKSVAWSAGGNLLASCARDKSVWIWEETADDEYETVAVLQEHEGDVKCVAWHPEEELVASASYDDEIRLWKDEGDDWTCIWVGRAHSATVWAIAWESLVTKVYDRGTLHEFSASRDGNTLDAAAKAQNAWLARRQNAGPRFLSCSDDRTIRVWRRNPRPRAESYQNRLSIIRSGNFGEDWVEEAVLPATHSRGIYAVAWSARSGRVVSAGGDGRIVVYQETLVSDPDLDQGADDSQHVTQWTVVACREAGHDVFEINHVIWATVPEEDNGDARRISKDGKEREIIITTGDDGNVKVWRMDI